MSFFLVIVNEKLAASGGRRMVAFDGIGQTVNRPHARTAASAASMG
jgi:hypothetical protein